MFDAFQKEQAIQLTSQKKFSTMTATTFEGKNPSKTSAKTNVKYEKLQRSISTNGKSCTSHTQIIIDPVSDQNIDLHIHTDTNVILKSKKWNKLIPYIHITLLYLLTLFLYLELRATKLDMYNFHLSMLNMSMRNMELEVSCFEELAVLKRMVEDKTLDRKKRNASEKEFLKIDLEVPAENFTNSPSLDRGSRGFILSNEETSSLNGLIQRVSRSPKGKKDNKTSNRRRSHKRRRKAPLSVHLRGARPDMVIDDEVSTGLIAPWFIEKQSISNFDLSKNISLVDGKGYVQINEPGLYLIYAQVYYVTSNRLNSFTVSLMGEDSPGSKEEKELSTCSVWGPGNSTGEVSCFTSVVRPLAKGGRLFLKQRERNRRILFRDGQTFLGLVLLAPQPTGKRGNWKTP